MEPVKTILDIGSHQMQETEWMRKRWPESRIWCLEPDRRSVDWCIRHGMVEKLGVTLLPFAVTRETGVYDFWESTNGSADPDHEWCQSSSLHKPTQIGERKPTAPCGFGKKVSVVGVNLDYIIPANFQTIDLLWMDVQASELDVIRGATKTLKNTRFMMLEHNTSGVYENEPGINGILAALPDWEVLKMFPYDVFLRRK